jgi:adenylate cyclase
MTTQLGLLSDTKLKIILSLSSFVRGLYTSSWVIAITIPMLVAILCVIVVSNITLVKLAENHLSDVRIAILSPARPWSRDVAIVLIDEQSVAALPYRSPIDRSLITSLLSEIESRSAAAIGINILFDRPTELGKDQQLYDKLRLINIPVVVSQVSSGQGFSAKQVKFSNEFLGSTNTGLSLIFHDNTDNTVRSSILKLRQGKQVSLGFAAALALQLGIELPSNEKIDIDYYLGPELNTTPFPTYSASEITELPVSALEGRIVLIGSDLIGSRRLRTPFSVLNGRSMQSLSGIEIEAYVLTQLIENRVKKAVSPRDEALVILAMALFGSLITMGRMNLITKIAVSIIFLPLFWVSLLFIFVFKGSIYPMVTPTVAFIFTIVASSFWQWRNEFRQKEKIHHAFGQFLAPAVVEQILQKPDQIDLSGEVREVTFLFTDLEGFTHLIESMPPQIMVVLVNSYLEEACDIVIEHDGTIDKIVGDALHVMFNAPLLQQDHAERAVLCALALDEWSEEFRQRQLKNNINLGVTRIGVNTGKCIVGNFGGAKRFDYTAHGDAINSAARLEAINQRLGTRICVSESTVDQCQAIHFRSVATLVLRGKTEGIKTFLPVVDKSVNTKLNDQYEKAYQCLSDNDPDVADSFITLHEQYPDDPLIKLHLDRIEDGAEGTTLVIRKK